MRRSFYFLATKINIIFGWYCLSCFERMSHKRHSIHRPTEMTRNGDLKCHMICEQMPRAPSTTNEKMLPWWWRWDETWLAKHNYSEWWSAMHHPNEPPATPCPVKMDWQPTSVMQWPTESESLSGTDEQPAHDCPLAEDWRPTLAWNRVVEHEFWFGGGQVGITTWGGASHRPRSRRWDGLVFAAWY